MDRRDVGQEGVAKGGLGHDGLVKLVPILQLGCDQVEDHPEAVAHSLQRDLITPFTQAAHGNQVGLPLVIAPYKGRELLRVALKPSHRRLSDVWVIIFGPK